jgi:hypothetical protein
MVFTVISYEDISGHSAGFLGLIIALILVTIQNCIYILDSQVAYSFLGGLKGTRSAVIVYLISNLIISGYEVSILYHAVRTGAVAPWVTHKVGPIAAIQLVDWIWMFFNAILPLFQSFVRARTERGMQITIDMKPQKYLDEE